VSRRGDGAGADRAGGAGYRGWRFRGLGLAAPAALAAGVIWWASLPVSGGGGGTQPVLVIAIVTGAMSVAELAVATMVIPQPEGFGAADRVVHQVIGLISMLPWAELMTVAALVLEALHKSRPWHTAVLAVALTGYLLAVHLAETDARVGALRAQLPLLCAGAGLAALSVGAAALPGLPAGPVATTVRIGAVVLATVVAGLAVPVWFSRDR